ncbi:MAG: hypothetical protein N2037_01030 [Acidimicrobiales bacterium]|nr:hypothetical protein [Acidimicrobiales bacterium]
MTAADRYVVLGVAQVRSPWFGAVARWATGGLAPIEFIKCLSLQEVRARLASGRPFSALLVDADLNGLDRDLIDSASVVGCAVLVVNTISRRTTDWSRLGAAACLDRDFDAATLLETLAAHAQPIPATPTRLTEAPTRPVPLSWRGRLVAVTGSGGTGTSTVTRALAQGLGRDPRLRGRVLLADLTLHGDQAVLHDVGDIVPGIQELVEAHRLGTPEPSEVTALTYYDEAWGYALLLGLRRHRDWVTIRPRAFQASLDTLRSLHTMVVADIEPDFEGADECGSLDIEDRNAMARITAATADALVMTFQAGPVGIRRAVRLVDDLLTLGVAPERIVPVVNRAPRQPKARAEITAAFHEFTRTLLPNKNTPLHPPLFLSEKRKITTAIRDGAPMPAPVAGTLARVVTHLLDELAASSSVPVPELVPMPVVPGSLGHWAEEEEAIG